MVWIFLFVFGGLLGATCDAFHTHSGTEIYANPDFFMMPWWVPPEFGLATLMIGFTHLDFDKRFRQMARVPAWTEVVAGLGIFTTQYFVSGFMKVDEPFRLIGQGVIAMSLWLAFEGTANGLILAFATAIVGTIMEIGLSATGVFHYNQSDIQWHMGGVPLWLPFLYISGSVTVGNLARRIRLEIPRIGE